METKIYELKDSLEYMGSIMQSEAAPRIKLFCYKEHISREMILDTLKLESADIKVCSTFEVGHNGASSKPIYRTFNIYNPKYVTNK